MHSHQYYLNFTANAELARRDYTVLATFPDQTELMNIKNAVDYLQKRENITQPSTATGTFWRSNG